MSPFTMLPPGTVWQVLSDTLPGVALYAWLQAEQRQPNARQHRAVAYQAYQAEDYATALTARQKISLHDMSNEDPLAAANTARAAGNARLAIAGYNRQNNVDWETMPSTGGCMRNVTFQSAGTRTERSTRSINIAPSANAYAARATIYRQRHNIPAAVRICAPRWNWNRIIATPVQRLVTPCGIAVISHSRGKCLEQAHKRATGRSGTYPTTGLREPASDDIPATQHYARLVIDDLIIRR